MGEPVAATVDRGGCRRTRQGHAERFGHRGHGVGGVHAAAGTLARADRPLDPVQVGTADLAGEAGADRFEGVDDRDVLAVHLTGHDRARVQEDGGEVEPGSGHEHARQRLVAARQQHRTVEPLGHHHRLHGIGDHLARHQREVHALMSHGDAVGNRDGAELERVSPAGVHPVLDRLGQPIQRQIARGDLVPRGRHTDLRLGEVLVAHPDRTKHPACRGPLQAVGHVAGTGLQVRQVTCLRHLDTLHRTAAFCHASWRRSAAGTA